jgi:uncharacterized membrane protein YfcA
MAESLLTAFILFGATFVASTFGFGGALFAMPLLTRHLGIATATPLFGFVGPTISGIILARHWRLVELASAWRLIAATLVGIPIGIWLVKYAPEAIVTRLLGLFLVSFGLYRLCKWQLLQLDSPAWAAPVGFIAGILGGAYNTNGPPVVIYGEMRRWPPTQFRATLQSYFFPTGLGILVSHGIGGLWTEQVIQLYSWSLPGILAAIAIGGWLNQRIPAERFHTALSVLLMMLGVLLWV